MFMPTERKAILFEKIQGMDQKFPKTAKLFRMILTDEAPNFRIKLFNCVSHGDARAAYEIVKSAKASGIELKLSEVDFHTMLCAHLERKAAKEASDVVIVAFEAGIRSDEFYNDVIDRLRRSDPEIAKSLICELIGKFTGQLGQVAPEPPLSDEKLEKLSDEKLVADALARESGTPLASYIPSAPFKNGILNSKKGQNLEKIITEDYARKHCVLPLFVENKVLAVAMANIENMEVDRIKLETGMDVQPFVAALSQILKAIDDFYCNKEKDVL